METPPVTLSRTAKIVVLLLFTLSLALIVSSKLDLVNVGDLLARLTRELKDQGALGYSIFLLVFFVASLSGLVPLSALAVAGGAVYGLAVGFLLSGIGTMAGALAAFLLGRYALKGEIDRWVSKHITLALLDEAIAKRGWRFVFLLRLSPIAPFSLGSYAFGLTAVSLRDYFFGTLGALPALFAFVYAGAMSGLAISILSGRQAGPAPIQTAILIIGLVATGVAVIYLVQMARKAMRQDIANR